MKDLDNLEAAIDADHWVMTKGPQDLPHRKKENWGPGDWQNEPDRKLWKANGLDCLINRNRLGAWCGYVGLPKGHPLFGKEYQEIEEEGLADLRVHGGITYSSECQGEICHPNDDGDHIWWLGFDCAHGYDIIPSMDALKKIPGSPMFGFPEFDWPGMSKPEYRNEAYVTAQTERLAKQLCEMVQ